MEKEVRPWGNYEVLQDTERFKVKRVCVNPGSRLSLQMHGRRDELWTIVNGEGFMDLDHLKMNVKYGDTIDIRRGQRHRIMNTGTEPLVFVEVQTGDYFGEDDVVRYQDDYGRDTDKN